jgi:hypothetical protein
MRPYLKITNIKNAGGVAQGVGPDKTKKGWGHGSSASAFAYHAFDPGAN